VKEIFLFFKVKVKLTFSADTTVSVNVSDLVEVTATDPSTGEKCSISYVSTEKWDDKTVVAVKAHCPRFTKTVYLLFK